MPCGRRPATLFFAFVLFFTLGRVAPDLSSDRAALLAFREAVGPRLKWNLSSSPCSWRGVTCSGNGGGSRVTGLNLPGASLIGQIPGATIGNLTALRTLSLRFNALSGGLPPDLGNCTDLRKLYLNGNGLSGDIPSSLFSLVLLSRLDLSDNRFNGGVSQEFNKLTQLRTLNLASNNLTGSLPDLNRITRLHSFNVSYNQLTGPVPSSLRHQPASAFLGTALCGGPLSPCSSAVPPAPSAVPPVQISPAPGTSNSSKLSGGAIAGIVIGAVLGFLLVLALIVFLCCRGRNRQKQNLENGKAAEMPAAAAVVATQDERTRDMQTPPPPVANVGKKLVFLRSVAVLYDIEELLRASAEVLGKDTFGTTYRATLESGRAAVAVKRLKDVHLPEKEFRDQVVAIGAMQHDNLVPLQSYYYSRDEKLLVYEFVGIGSLSSLLHGNNGTTQTRLDFKARSCIALSAARGIEYIHSVGAKSSHGNIKSSNIVVTASHEALVANYGLMQLVGATVTPKRGAGYRAPEATGARNAPQKADVYSFGVLLLELVTGRAPAHALPNGEGVDLPRWVQSVAQEEWTAEVFDAELMAEQDVEEEMMQLLQVGMDCTAQHPGQRPEMSSVVARLERIAEKARQRNGGDIDSSQDQMSRQYRSV